MSEKLPTPLDTTKSPEKTESESAERSREELLSILRPLTVIDTEDEGPKVFTVIDRES